jgi:hypothetical protein
VQDNLTHTNALLSLELSQRCIKHHEALLVEKGANAAVEASVTKLINHFWMLINRVPEISNQVPMFTTFYVCNSQM